MIFHMEREEMEMRIHEEAVQKHRVQDAEALFKFKIQK
jgi:hypothetical protein